MSDFRLVLVSDLHLGACHEHHYDNWQKIAAWIAREKPDLVVANGDLVMEDPDAPQRLLAARRSSRRGHRLIENELGDLRRVGERRSPQLHHGLEQL